MATPAPAAALPVPGPRWGRRDLATPLTAAAALAALALLPWAADGGPTALGLVAAGTYAKWPHFAATLSLAPLLVAAAAAAALAWRGFAGATALAAGFGLAWAFGQGLAAGTSGPAFGIGAAIAL
ncbi:MAG TPA: hypothetical protein VF059_05255, partial [Casimicrobiaceae bacterium]